MEIHSCYSVNVHNRINIQLFVITTKRSEYVNIALNDRKIIVREQLSSGKLMKQADIKNVNNSVIVHISGYFGSRGNRDISHKAIDECL